MTSLSRVAQLAFLEVLVTSCSTVGRSDPGHHTSTARPSSTTAAAPAFTAAPAETAKSVASAVPPPNPCPDSMVSIEGSYCTQYELECLEKRKPWQCAKYKEPGVCNGEVIDKRFCIDRYEYPNQKGAIATVMSSWNSAKAQCEALDKRLCTDAEWTLACEGPDRLAFPYGYERDAEACPIDKRSPKVNEQRLFWKQTQADEVARLDQREPSGSRERCVSAYGVYDLTGNVDEWVFNESGRPYKSGLKGGNWGEYRNACRPTTRGHDEGFYYYQTGFRCCRDLPSD